MPDPTAAPPSDAGTWLAPSDTFLHSLLALPELALADEDARANYEIYLAVRDALCAAGTLEAYYLALLRGGPIAIPPVFVERIVAAIVEHLLAGNVDPFERRAGQL